MRKSFVAFGLALSISIIFLQVGVTYYVSVQTFAMLLMMAIVLKGRPVLQNPGFVLLSVLLFTVFLALTESRAPVAISENSENIFLTVVGIVGYAAMILIACNLYFISPAIVLLLLRFAASFTILSTFALIVIADLEISSFLSRESLILQNATLITNYTSHEALTESFAYLQAAGLKPALDLFYGEQSFLAVVLFACVTCRIICEKLIVKPSTHQPHVGSHISRGGLLSLSQRHSQTVLITLGLGMMIYIESFSSLFYVIIIVASLFFSAPHRHFKRRVNLINSLMMVLALILLVKVALFAFDYYTYRVSAISESLSFEQRFASFFEFGVADYLLGMVDVSNMPPAGFHNSIIYTIAISGIGGICLLMFIVYRVYLLARPLKIPVLAVACVLGIFSQNGAVFSPNKVVILSLVLLPLACVERSKRKKPVSQQGSYSHV